MGSEMCIRDRVLRRPISDQVPDQGRRRPNKERRKSEMDRKRTEKVCQRPEKSRSFFGKRVNIDLHYSYLRPPKDCKSSPFFLKRPPKFRASLETIRSFPGLFEKRPDKIEKDCSAAPVFFTDLSRRKGEKTSVFFSVFLAHRWWAPAVVWHALQQWVPPLLCTSGFLVKLHAGLAHLLAYQSGGKIQGLRWRGLCWRGPWPRGEAQSLSTLVAPTL